MATFYIKSSEGVYELSSTTDIKIEHTSSPTRHKIENGSTITDHIINENTKISFNGLISEIKSFGVSSDQSDGEKANISSGNTQTNVKTYVNGLRKIRDNKELVSIIYDNRFEQAKNCVITNISMDRNSSVGTGYTITLAFEQVRISERAKLSVLREVQENPDKTQDKTNSSGTNTEDAGKPSESLFVTTGESIYNFATGGN